MKSANSRRNSFSKMLLSSSLYPWVLMDCFNVFWAFNLFAQFGRQASLPTIQRENFIASLTLTFSFALIGIALGFFERENRMRRLEFVRLGLLSWLAALTVSITFLHFAFFMKLGRFALVYGSAGALCAVLGFRFFMAWALRNNPHRFFIIGELTPTSEELISYSRATGQGHLQHIDNLREKIFENHEMSLERATQVMEADHVSDMVLSSSPIHRDRMAALATLALQKGLRVIDEGRFYGEIFRRYPLENLSTNWIIYAGIDVQNPITNFFKRSSDIFLSLFLLICLSPFLIGIALTIKFMSPGPVFYIQVRQGRYARSFKMVKFRTMNVHDSGSAATAPGDSRITSIGKLLRPMHLDELPQLWNILLGEMSFVGPRPEAISVVENMRKALPIYEIRHMLRPGLTGWAQINQGKTQDGFEEVRHKLSYDLYYLKNYGLVFDLVVMLKTVFVITKRNW